jgi:site-specific DNA recombinase
VLPPPAALPPSHKDKKPPLSPRDLPAFEIESLVMATVRNHLKLAEQIDDHSLIEQHVARIEVETEQLVIQFAREDEADDAGAVESGTLRVPWQKRVSTRRREILVPGDATPGSLRPIRSETRATLVTSIARGRRWLVELLSNAAATSQTIAKREGCSVRKINMTLSLAFLAPDLVKAAIEGRLPHGMGFSRLTDLPADLASARRSACPSSKPQSNPVSACAALPGTDF